MPNYDDDDDYSDGGYENDGYEQDEKDEAYDVMPTSSQQSPSRNDQGKNRRAAPSNRTSQSGVRTSGNGVAPQTRQSTNGYVPDRNLTDAQRATGLHRLKLALAKKPHITLSQVIIDDVFAMAPISQSELAGMARSVYANKKIGSTQTNDDDKGVETQTDVADLVSASCQAPEDLSHGLARDVAVRMIDMDPEVERKLNIFIHWAGPLVLAAMGMAPKTKVLAITSDNSGKGLSGGMAKLEFAALLANRPVNSISYDPGSSPNLLVAYGPVNASLGAAELLRDHSLGSRGCLVVWDMSELTTPAHILVSEGTPTCCCWAPPPTLGMVFAGMEEGGVCVWDLEENESRHPTEQIVPDKAPTVTRRPSFSTECLANEASAAPIVAIQSIAKEGSRMTPCHVVSLTAWGEVTVYTLSVLNSLELANADIDLGMRYGSKVRLLKTGSNIKLGMNVLYAPGNKNSTASQLLQTFSLGVFPGQTRQFIVGSDAGKVLRGAWVGQPPAPKEYLGQMPPKTMDAANSLSFMPSVASNVTSVHISPFCPDAFLAGHSDGTVALHSTEMSTPVYMWPSVVRGAVNMVRWSPVRPCAFYVLDSTCTLYCFDLLSKFRPAPVHTEQFLTTDRKTGIAVFCTTFETAHIFNGPNGPGDGKASFAVGYDDGQLHIHLLNKKFADVGGNELKTLMALCAAPPKLVRKVEAKQLDKFEGDEDARPNVPGKWKI